MTLDSLQRFPTRESESRVISFKMTHWSKINWVLALRWKQESTNKWLVSLLLSSVVKDRTEENICWDLRVSRVCDRTQAAQARTLDQACCVVFYYSKAHVKITSHRAENVSLARPGALSEKQILWRFFSFAQMRKQKRLRRPSEKFSARCQVICAYAFE